MDFVEISRQNPWWKNASEIMNDDKLKLFQSATYKWIPRLKHHIVFDRDKIYTLRGPRQVGKTTLSKILIKDLIDEGKDPKGILYCSCDLITNGNELFKMINAYLEWVSSFTVDRKYIFLDEISNVKNWESSLKYLVDAGRLKNTSLLLTGSHSIDIKKSIERLPGRRGEGEETIDKILVPMKFAEFAETVNPGIKDLFQKEELFHSHKRQEIIYGLFEGKKDPIIDTLRLYQDDLNTLFNQYLITGGIPKPINEFFSNGNIDNSTYEIYIRSLMGDLARWDASEVSIKKILRSIFLQLTTNVSWIKLAETSGISSHNTVSAYVDKLDNAFVLNVLYSIDINKKTSNFKKEKKIYPQDPFIFHSLNSWTSGSSDYFGLSQEYLNNPESKSKLVEAVVQSHLVRLMYNTFPSDVFSAEDHLFYMKTKTGKEIDFILKSKDTKLLPIELKYQNSINSGDYTSLREFKNGILLSKNDFAVDKNHVTIPVALFLLLI